MWQGTPIDSMTLFINAISLILGLIFLTYSKREYNFYICLVCLLLFISSVAPLIYRDIKNKRYLTFNNLFYFSFFLTSFCLPVFVLKNDSVYEIFSLASMAVFQQVDFTVITSATCLCLIAINCYNIGFICFPKKKKDLCLRKIHKKYVALLQNILFVLVLVNVFIVIRSGEYKFIERQYVYQLYFVIYTVSLIPSDIIERHSIYQFMKANKIPFFETLLIVLIFLLFNERGNAIILILITFFMLSVYYIRIKIGAILLMVTMGVLLMFSIRLAKMTNSTLTESNDKIDVSQLINKEIIIAAPFVLFSDLIGADMELCICYDIKESKGLQNPEQIILLPTLPFPGLPSLLASMIYDKSYADYTGSNIINDYFEDVNATFGKHCVGDIYMRWGLVGIFIFFLMLFK